MTQPHIDTSSKSRVRLSIDVDASARRALKIRAAAEGKTISEVVIDALQSAGALRAGAR